MPIENAWRDDVGVELAPGLLTVPGTVKAR
jgi:hypothetical protein